MQKIAPSIYLFLILTCLTVLSCIEKPTRKAIELTITNSPLHVENNNLKIDLEIENRTDTTFLLLAFKNLHGSEINEEFYKKNGIASGNALLISNSDHQPVLQEINSHDLELQELPNLWCHDQHNCYIENMLILKPGKSSVSLTTSLDVFEFQKGQYEASVIYYSGTTSTVFVSEELQNDLEEQYGAVIFRNWLKSSNVDITID